MSAFDEAQSRLETAMGRLEAVMAKRSEADEGGRETALMADVKSLREECDKLRGKLDSSNKRYARMQEVVGEVAGRLEKTIGELDTLLEG